MSNAAPLSSASRDAVIFDMDGTLCDVRSIRHFVQRPAYEGTFKPNFDGFHAASISCPPHLEVQQLAMRAHALGFYILVVTGREAKWRGVTAEWLGKNQIPCDGLWTRRAKDNRPDHVVKAEIELEISKQFHAVLAVDDRLDILDVWRSAGIPTVRISTDGKVALATAPNGSSIDPRARELLQVQVM